MSTGANLRDEIATGFISSDITFSRRFLESVMAHPSDTIIPIFCMNNYLSLYIHESHKALKGINPAIAASLEYEHGPIIERARHTVKLFDDTNQTRGRVGGVSDQFKAIIDAHRSFFLNSIWFPPARLLGTDLGLWRYRGRAISTTHVASFYLGIPPEAFKDMNLLRQQLMAVGAAQGEYITKLSGATSWAGPSFTDAMNFGDVKNTDVRAERYYKAVFDPALQEGTTAALTAFECSLNFLDVLLSADVGSDSADAIFKLKFITLYHVISSLTKLQAEYAATLSPASQDFLDAILKHQTSVDIVRDSSKGFRNTLIHYRPYDSVVAQLSLTLPLYGLVEAHYPDYNHGQMSQAVNEHTARLAGLLDEWSQAGARK
ncbi:hypothetical protein [Streptomyces sp. NPDC051554]|uniref:hypothetical protein n=1 Tax=Streptomyces sp. NPDC051554 TaxID=3365656 RepID=UPI0037B77476